MTDEFHRLIRKRLGERVRALLGERGVFAMDLAARAGLRASHLSEITGGHKDIRLSSLVRIAHGLDMTIEELVRGIDAPPVPGDDLAAERPHDRAA